MLPRFGENAHGVAIPEDRIALVIVNPETPADQRDTIARELVSAIWQQMRQRHLGHAPQAPCWETGCYTGPFGARAVWGEEQAFFFEARVDSDGSQQPLYELQPYLPKVNDGRVWVATKGEEGSRYETLFLQKWLNPVSDPMNDLYFHHYWHWIDGHFKPPRKWSRNWIVYDKKEGLKPHKA
ncbi:uncharacterized protein BP01DRAFT_384127 [Aspergillus saccharolyticus JOP 1030-1]|uniref:Uncharacterized protein n=1 Tax=Aspergillus saccharolyticus JOP 1030-1 TaxID=1450539 RepID=A0A318ZGP1_9EURO|nr:hypothetical protein BP01DRAFT_384127 [Aspergillus saccharolyticus JOP 1030-1]PYH43743.1 hypothetical protein BP01DRAFT_384127 [Aspergillus saccharolyticus JOP 1030-1]